MRETILRWGCAAMLLAIVGSCALAVDLTKDDVHFRKELYVDKKGDKLPYRLFVPSGYGQHLSAGVVTAWRRGPRQRETGRARQCERRARMDLQRSTVDSRICTRATGGHGGELVRPGIQF
jgi:hypothetical protein